MITKIFKVIIPFLILVSCGNAGRGLYEVTLEITEDQVNFIVTGLSDQADDYPELGKKFYFQGYPRSYVTHRISANEQLQVVFSLSLDDYYNNINPSTINLQSLPDGRALPLIKKFGGGDGVGNGKVHGGFAQFDSDFQAGIYQNGEAIGVFYPKLLSIGTDNIVHARQNVEKRKGYVALIGESKDGTTGGALLVLPEPDLK